MKRFVLCVLILIFGTMLIGCKENGSNQNQTFYNIYTGILSNNKEFEDGASIEFEYDFDCEEYETLIEVYKIDEIASEGSEFERAFRLVNEFAPRLHHYSTYDGHIKHNSLDLLEYSLDNKKQGINCKFKSKILAEMCLALEIPARRVFIMPYSPNDSDNHVVTEIYDSIYEKWIMLDMTLNGYFVDEHNLPLSILEIRELGSKGEFLTMVIGNDKTDDLQALFTENLALNQYIMKNMFYFIYETYNGFGLHPDSKSYYLLPSHFDAKARDLANIQYRINISGSDEDSIKNLSLQKESLEKVEYLCIDIESAIITP